MEEALKQINEDGDKIIGTFYIADSSQVCLVTEKRPSVSSFKEFMKDKDGQKRND